MMASYNMLVSGSDPARPNGFVPAAVPAQQANAVPPVLQQTRELFQPYTPVNKKDENQ